MLICLSTFVPGDSTSLLQVDSQVEFLILLPVGVFLELLVFLDFLELAVMKALEGEEASLVAGLVVCLAEM